MSLRELRNVHPRVETIALWVSGDLDWRLRWRTGRHIEHCGPCGRQAKLFQSARAELKREAETETLTGFEAIADWDVLEREMVGNIAVGLAAARCIDNVGRRSSLTTKAAFAAALIALFVVAWATHIPREDTERVLASVRHTMGWNRPAAVGTVVETTPNGIAVRTAGATLTILHPRSAVVSVSGAAAVQARYVDEETGQVTIASVYGQ